MTHIMIKDLEMNQVLDKKAMASVRGGLIQYLKYGVTEGGCIKNPWEDLLKRILESTKRL